MLPVVGQIDYVARPEGRGWCRAAMRCCGRLLEAEYLTSSRSWPSASTRSGGDGKTVSERLGHASTAFTMDVFAASVLVLEEETAAKVAALLDW